MRSFACVLAIVVLTCAAHTSSAAQAFDVLIRNGRIMDGTGSPWYAADIGIRNGRIAAVGRLHNATATTTIDAKNLLVTPGFIDMLGQSELTILVEPHLPSKIFQGITTEITGEGNSAAPINDRTIAVRPAGLRASADQAGLAVTVGILHAVGTPGNGDQPRQLRRRNFRRRVVIGEDNRAPSPQSSSR